MSSKGIMISGFKTVFPIATIFWNRYCSLTITCDSNTLMGKATAALKDKIYISVRASEISEAVKALFCSSCGIPAAMMQPRVSTTAPRIA